jgi:hypothetical protein
LLIALPIMAIHALTEAGFQQLMESIQVNRARRHAECAAGGPSG